MREGFQRREARTPNNLPKSIETDNEPSRRETQFRPRLLAEELFCGHLERLGKVEQPFLERASPAVLHTTSIGTMRVTPTLAGASASHQISGLV